MLAAALSSGARPHWVCMRTASTSTWRHTILRTRCLSTTTTPERYRTIPPRGRRRSRGSAPRKRRRGHHRSTTGLERSSRRPTRRTSRKPASRRLVCCRIDLMMPQTNEMLLMSVARDQWAIASLVENPPSWVKQCLFYSATERRGNKNGPARLEL